MNHRSQDDGTPMVTVECPWCAGTAHVAADELRCPECGIVERIGPDLPTLEVVAQATPGLVQAAAA